MTQFTSEQFSVFFNNQDFSTKRMIFSEAVVENNPDEEFFDFDENFFTEIYTCNAIEAIRSWSFGHKENGDANNYNDPYIRFNGYANFCTMNEWEAEEWMLDHIGDMEEYLEDNYRDEMLEYFDIEEDDQEDED